MEVSKGGRSLGKAGGMSTAAVSGIQTPELSPLSGYNVIDAIVTENGNQFVSKPLLPSEASRIIEYELVQHLLTQSTTWGLTKYPLIFDITAMADVLATCNYIISVAPLTQFLGRKWSYVGYSNFIAEYLGLTGKDLYYYPQDIFDGLREIGKQLPLYVDTDKAKVGYLFFDTTYDHMLYLENNKVALQWLTIGAVLITAIVIVFAPFAALGIGTSEAAVIIGSTVTSISKEVYNTVKDVAVDVVSAVKTDVVDKLTDVDTYIDVGTQLVTDNIKNLLNDTRNDINKEIRAFADKSGLDLSAVTELVTGVTSKFTRDTVALLETGTKDILTEILKHDNAVNTALTDPLSNERQAMVDLNTAIGKGMAAELFNLIFETSQTG